MKTKSKIEKMRKINTSLMIIRDSLTLLQTYDDVDTKKALDVFEQFKLDFFKALHSNVLFN